MCLGIAKEVGSKSMEGTAYSQLGNAFGGLGDFKTSIVYHNLHLTIVKDLSDKAGEGAAYGNLGNTVRNLGDFKKAIEYHRKALSIAKELGNKSGEGIAYANLGNAFHCLGDFQKAIDYHNQHLEIAKDLCEIAAEGRAYGNLGSDFQYLGNFKKAIAYHNLHLSSAKQVGDFAGEGRAYGNIGVACDGLCDFKKAIEYYQLSLSIAKEVNDKDEEGCAYSHLGIAFQSLGDFERAIYYHKLHLRIVKEVGNKAREGTACCNLGIAFGSLSDFRNAIKYQEQSLNIAKQTGNKSGERTGYTNLGVAYQCLGDIEKAKQFFTKSLDIAKAQGNRAAEGCAYLNLGNIFQILHSFEKAIHYHTLSLNISKEVQDMSGEGRAYFALGRSFELLESLPKALQNYQFSVNKFNEVRSLLQTEDEWKIGFRDTYQISYNALWRTLLKLGKFGDALLAAEEGRAQALTDLIREKCGILRSQFGSNGQEMNDLEMLSFIPSTTVFQAVDSGAVHAWVHSEERAIRFVRKKIDDPFALDNVKTYLQELIETAYKEIGVQVGVRCEDRSMDSLREDRQSTEENSADDSTEHSLQQNSSLHTLYKIAIKPFTGLVQGNQLIIVPDGPLWLAPYAAFLDSDSKFLCESFKIRLIPSLTSLKLIADCPEDYHSRNGAMLVGDPWVAQVTDGHGNVLLKQLPFARKEAEMIGKLLKESPLIGKEATKDEVLRRLSSVALVHIAAHGCMETGEIALTPNPHRTCPIPKKDDYVLRMKDVLNVQLRARLVVLSCCHSGRGRVKAEGVVGIARAFMGAGARSVLVTLWAIDDEATLEFMRSFYYHLAEGRSASESLNQAVKFMRESDEYSDPKYWAPFVLIGDDVFLEFGGAK